MKIAPWLGAVLALGLAVPASWAGDLFPRFLLERTNRKIQGVVVDYTDNHGKDHRLWSEALQCKCDVYVYVPPGYDPAKQYPVALWLHAFRDDEVNFLDNIVPRIDEMMVCGKMPKMIIVSPDGSIKGHRTYITAGSFFVNSKAGNFQDYVIQDVWAMVMRDYSVRPEREAHVIIGASMGGGAAFNIAMKHPELFKVVVGVFPPVNLRWQDCHGNPRANFDPCCWGWRENIRPHETVGRIFGIPIKSWQLVRQIYGTGPDAIDQIAEENPIELLERLDIKPGQFDMYIGYAGKDQFNIDAEVESFLYKAKERGIHIEVGYEPKGRHGPLTALKLVPGITCWLKELLGPYEPE